MSSGRKVIQRALFASLSREVTPDMYATVASGKALRQRSRVELSSGASVALNTYFGRFAASYWQRWTTVADLAVEFTYATDGELLVQVMRSDSLGRSGVETSLTLTGAGKTRTPLALNRFYDGGAMWLEVHATNGHATVEDVVFTANSPDVERGASVAICTFNRADDCLATIDALTCEAAVLDDVSAIFVVDQGADTVASREGFGAIAQRCGDKLIYLQQPNLGGAGGFSRGMIESLDLANGNPTNVVVMDDDIRCEPETLLRLNAFANYTVRPTLVGAQMLSMVTPHRSHLSAEREVLAELKAGEPTANAKSYVNLLKKKQDATFDAGWNGWWTCLIPSEVIAQLGFAIPLFFQWDDIEYGIRARNAGFPTVTLPNAGVWHQDFHLKDYDDWSRYYAWRNGLIIAALYGGFDGKVISKYVFKHIAKLIVSMQYGLAATMLKGVEDFLVGPEVLQDGGRSMLTEIRQLRAAYPETVPVSPKDFVAGMDAHAQIDVWDFEPDERKLDLVLAKRAVFQVLGRVDSRPVNIPATHADWWHVSLFSNAAVTDASQAAVRMRRRDKDKALALGKRNVVLCRELRSRFDELKPVYQGAMSELTGKENWERLIYAV